MGRNGPEAKTKTVLKSLREGEQLGKMPNKVFSILTRIALLHVLEKRPSKSFSKEKNKLFT